MIESMENLHLKMDLQSPTSNGDEYDRTPCSTPLSEVYTPLSETCTSISEACTPCTPLSEAVSPLSETYEPLIAATSLGPVDNVEENTTVVEPLPEPKKRGRHNLCDKSGSMTIIDGVTMIVACCDFKWLYVTYLCAHLNLANFSPLNLLVPR